MRAAALNCMFSTLSYKHLLDFLLLFSFFKFLRALALYVFTAFNFYFICALCSLLSLRVLYFSLEFSFAVYIVFFLWVTFVSFWLSCLFGGCW